ncbi:acyl carrier protein [Campylobacter volucris]|uniref:acyl carrier protein n=1 Tax=Campylobacter volucris TaxID=1031542 RepID=UPI0018A0FD2B|nr:acyl carrier protein [Campylobacter volucris]MBF7046660.1 acyl carrier protein [Campylobacter volucris]
MEQKIYEILSNVLEIKVDDKTNFNMQNCESWTSLSHIDIIMSLEEEFEIKFDKNILTKLNSQEEIIKEIKKIKNAHN